MSSKSIVEVVTIDKVLEHPNADKIDLAIIKGWQCVVPKSKYKTGDRVVYFPPDTCIPEKLAKELGVDNYTQSTAQGERIRQCRLRGEPSFGLVIDAKPEWQIGQDLVEHFDAVRFEPPIKTVQGGSCKQHPLFPKYTDIENLRNFPDVIETGEEVYISEKLHGSLCMVGLVDGERMAGSHRVRRKEPENYVENRYWYPWSLEPVQNLLEDLSRQHKQVVLYGEIVGRQIQGKFHYNNIKDISFHAFDILIDGKYIEPLRFLSLAKARSLPLVPILYIGRHEGLDHIRQFANGETTIEKADHIREGVVIKPIKERRHPKIGRVALKYVSDDYLLGKHHLENDTTDV